MLIQLNIWKQLEQNQLIIESFEILGGEAG